MLVEELLIILGLKRLDQKKSLLILSEGFLYREVHL